MTAKKPRIVIFIDDGIVELIQTNVDDLEVVVLDEDCDGITPKDPWVVASKSGETAARSFPDVVSFASDTGWTEEDAFKETKLEPRLHLSKGNAKIGSTFNVSLWPGGTCSQMPCFDLCYARKGRSAQPQTINAWKENLLLFSLDSSAFFNEIRLKLSKRKPGYFRWHVGGEIPDQRYLDGLAWVASTLPRWQFALYTKRFDLDWEDALTLKNLFVRFSCWPSVGVLPPPIGPLSNVPKFWTLEPGNRLTPGLKCSAHCETCRACWHRKPLSIWITRH